MPWTIRYRFRVATPLTSDATELTVAIGEREAFIKSDGDTPLRESNWLTLQIHGLESEDAAQVLGKRVAVAVLVAGVRRGIGIDAGEDRATSSFGKVLYDGMMKQGKKLLPEVHGLSVFEREGNEVFLRMSARLTATSDPIMFLSEIASSFSEVHAIGEREQTALTLIALSRIVGEPLAEAALCISAVECLSSDVPWTPAQIKLLNDLTAQAAASTALSPELAQEVADGIDRVFKSIRQSIKRKMTTLGFTRADWKLFNDMYSLRSGILHGSITARSQHRDLAIKAQELCTRVVMAAAMRDPSATASSSTAKPA